MAVHNTARSISYHLTMKEDQWVVWCVMLLFRARLLTGQSRELVSSIVRLVQKRKRLTTKRVNSARRMLRANHTEDLATLLNREGQRA